MVIIRLGMSIHLVHNCRNRKFILALGWFDQVQVLKKILDQTKPHFLVTANMFFSPDPKTYRNTGYSGQWIWSMFPSKNCMIFLVVSRIDILNQGWPTQIGGWATFEKIIKNFDFLGH